MNPSVFESLSITVQPFHDRTSLFSTIVSISLSDLIIIITPCVDYFFDLCFLNDYLAAVTGFAVSVFAKAIYSGYIKDSTLYIPSCISDSLNLSMD
jgi:hypothetical protein